MASEEKARDYVVVTRVTPERVGGREVVHVYGPYGQAKAKSVKSNFRAYAIREGYDHRLSLNVCHIIDIEAMNRQAVGEAVEGLMDPR